ncbi:hypothetical protein JCGZ_15528 [Jatropha curcas]|uniref:Uncharacterized protein n=1 Tax=Jatropha curcas TaxID=180498 RepID=A0A067K3R1_JATCU|nr:hypothetical protein JCGZ_15528 [Jatropha curcas]
MNVFMDKVTGKKIDVMDSPINQSPTSKPSAKQENESSSKCAKELGGQPPLSPSGALTVVVLSLKRSINHHIEETSRCTTHQRHHSRQAAPLAGLQ